MSRRGPPPKPLELPGEVRQELERVASSRSAAHGLVLRSRIVLLAADRLGTSEIAAQLGVVPRTVRKWKQRFRANPVLASLKDADRSGRPSRIPLEVRCQLVRVACERPDKQSAPFRDVWTYKTLANRLWWDTGHRLSESEVGRILRFEKLRPHRVQQWLGCRDPNFLPKAKAICDLYLHAPQDALVLCVDEKPMQALERKHPTHVGPGAVVRYEFEYIRHGVAVLLGAFDIATGDVFGQVVPHRTAEALVAFMEEVAVRHPSRTIYVVWDNLNTHYDGPTERWTRFNERHGKRFHFVYTPIHASWMNQIEIWFSILHRRVLKHGSFESTAHLAEQVESFIDHWNLWEGHPFRWTWRTDKLQNQRRTA